MGIDSRRNFLKKSGAALGVVFGSLTTDSLFIPSLDLELMYVEGEEFADENLLKVKEALDFLELDTRETQIMSREEFYEDYSRDGRVWAEDIIGEEESLWSDCEEQVMTKD